MSVITTNAMVNIQKYDHMLIKFWTGNRVMFYCKKSVSEDEANTFIEKME